MSSMKEVDCKKQLITIFKIRMKCCEFEEVYTKFEFEREYSKLREDSSFLVNSVMIGMNPRINKWIAEMQQLFKDFDDV